jgi:hypothetical protein
MIKASSYSSLGLYKASASMRTTKYILREAQLLRETNLIVCEIKSCVGYSSTGPIFMDHEVFRESGFLPKLSLCGKNFHTAVVKTSSPVGASLVGKSSSNTKQYAACMLHFTEEQIIRERVASFEEMLQYHSIKPRIITDLFLTGKIYTYNNS